MSTPRDANPERHGGERGHDDVDRLFDRELSDAMRRDLLDRAHADAAMKRRILDTTDAIRQLREPVAAPDLTEAVLAEIAQRRGFRSRQGRRSVLRQRLAVAAGLVVLLGGVALLHREAPYSSRLAADQAPITELVDGVAADLGGVRPALSAIVTAEPPASGPGAARATGLTTGLTTGRATPAVTAMREADAALRSAWSFEVAVGDVGSSAEPAGARLVTPGPLALDTSAQPDALGVIGMSGRQRLGLTAVAPVAETASARSLAALRSPGASLESSFPAATKSAFDASSSRVLSSIGPLAEMPIVTVRSGTGPGLTHLVAPGAFGLRDSQPEAVSIPWTTLTPATPTGSDVLALMPAGKPGAGSGELPPLARPAELDLTALLRGAAASEP